MQCRVVTEYVRLHEMQGATVVIMALASEVVAAFAIKDPIKPEASAVVKALRKAGIKACSPGAIELPAFCFLLCSEQVPRDPASVLTIVDTACLTLLSNGKHLLPFVNKLKHLLTRVKLFFWKTVQCEGDSCGMAKVSRRLRPSPE